MRVLALTTGQAILVGVGVGVLLAVLAVGLYAGRARAGRAAALDIPPGMRAGPSDADLEKPILEKLQAWGVVFVLFFAVWLPVVFLTEPDTNEDDTREMIEKSVERGEMIVAPGTEENPMGFNCERCHGEGLGGGRNVYNGNLVVVPNLRTVCGGADHGHPLIEDYRDVVEVIARGREGTDMPSWSVRFAGAMHDQQVNDVVNYLLSIQEVPDQENVCLGQQAPTGEEGATPEPTGEEGATPEPTGTGSPGGTEG